MRKTLFIVLSMLVAVGASAAELHDFYIIPVAAHTFGANGTAWRSEVKIQNPSSTPLTIELSAIKSGEGLTDNIVPLQAGIVVPAGGVVTLSDVLDRRGPNPEDEIIPSGALLVGGDKPFAVTSRTFNATSHGTYGQTVDAASEVAGQGASIFIPGLVANAEFRTNIGLLMVATTPMTVVVGITDENGRTLGKRTFNVAAGSTTHVQFPTTSVAPGSFDAAGAIIRVLQGSGSAIAYASVVDNVSGDASYITGGFDVAVPVEPLSSLLSRR